MNHRLVDFVNMLLMYDWLMYFMNNRLMMLMYNLFMFFFNDVFMVLMNDILMLLFDNWSLHMSLDDRFLMMLDKFSLKLLLVYNSWLEMLNDNFFNFSLLDNRSFHSISAVAHFNRFTAGQTIRS
jgi:hypothetical protein